MAGMLVIPGTGIATAEDMQEVREPTDRGAGSEAAELPADAPPPDVEPTSQATAESSEDSLRKEAKAAIDEMAEGFPETLALFKAWAEERGYARLSEVTNPALRGLVRKAENMLADAKSATAAQSSAAAEPEPPPAAAETAPAAPVEPEEPDVKAPARDPLED